MCGYSVKSGCGYSSDYSRYRSGFSPTSCGGGCGGSVSSCGGGCLCSSRYPFNGIIKLDNMTQEELNKVLEAHKHYIAEDCDGWSTMRADFRNMNLCGTDFSGADLSYSDLRGANLNGANLSDANLYGVKYNESTACFSLVCPEDGKQIRFKMYIACLDMADFKKQEIIDKALKWINDNMCYYDENGFDYSGSGILKDFKKAMEK